MCGVNVNVGRIAEVNGKVSAEEMLYELTVGEILEITLKRESVSMKHLDLCYNLLGAGSQELMALTGGKRKGSMLGNQARLDGGSRIVLLNAY